jgi:hypothetical protein
MVRSGKKEGSIRSEHVVTAALLRMTSVFPGLTAARFHLSHPPYTLSTLLTSEINEMASTTTKDQGTVMGSRSE